MSKNFRAADFDTHPPELYSSVTESQQRGGFLPEKKESLAGSPTERSTDGKYMALRMSTADDPEGDNEYDIIPGEGLDPGPASRARQSTEKPKNIYYGMPGSSVRGGEQKVTKNSMYEDCDVKKIVHPTLTRRGSQVWNGDPLSRTPN